MDREMHRIARELGVNGEYLFEAERRKRILANSVLIRTREELQINPETERFTYALPPTVGKLERFVLSHYPHEISRRIHSNEPLTLSLDESVEPPKLTVTIGSPAER